MPFVAGKDQRAERARHREDELVSERAKYAAELIKRRIRKEGVIQAQYPQVFGFKAQQTIHNHFRSGKVTLIDLIRIVSTPGFDISLDYVLRTAITVVEPDEEGEVVYSDPDPDCVAILTSEKVREKPKQVGPEVDDDLFLSEEYSRFADLFKQATGETDGESSTDWADSIDWSDV